MAHRLSRIIGTEEDKVNCPFYYKIGACRHGDKCSRTHLKPRFSPTIMLPHMYTPPTPVPSSEHDAQQQCSPEVIASEKQYFFNFYDDVASELSKYGDIEVLNIVSNLGAHMFGNVYVKYTDEVYSSRAMKGLVGRYYAGRQLVPEYSPVSDFREARCGMYEDGTCNRGDYCNFIHVHKVPKQLKYLLIDLADERHEAKQKQRQRSESPANESSHNNNDSTTDTTHIPETDAERRARIKQWNMEKQASHTSG